MLRIFGSFWSCHQLETIFQCFLNFLAKIAQMRPFRMLIITFRGQIRIQGGRIALDEVTRARLRRLHQLRCPTNTEARRFGSADPGQEIRRKKLEAYLDNDLEPTDGTFGRVLAGTMLVIIFSLLFGVVQYYGGIEGLASITEKQRSIRGI